MKLGCQRCQYEWNYRGKSKWYTSCPRCRTSINVKKGMKYLAEKIKNKKIK